MFHSRIRCTLCFTDSTDLFRVCVHGLDGYVVLCVSDSTDLFRVCVHGLDGTIAEGHSLCLSVTLVIHAKMVQDIEMCFAPYDRLMSLAKAMLRLNI